MLCFQIDLEDPFEPDTPEINLFDPEPYDYKSRKLPTIKEDVRPESKLKIPVNVVKKKVKNCTIIKISFSDCSMGQVKTFYS